MKWILMLFTIISLKTCDNSGILNQNIMLNGTYNIITLNGKDISEFELTIAFNDSTEQVSGFSGCNRFFGPYTIDRNTLKLGPLASTKRMCSPKFNDVESKILDALLKLNSFSVDDDILKLLGDNNILIQAIKLENDSLSISFEYTTHSRGNFQNIKVNEKSISVQNKRNGSIIKYTCDNEQWKKLMESTKTINIKAIQNLEAPSQKRLYDGAAMATLKIIYDGKTYITPTFDHGNPHPEIVNLVKEILSTAQNIE
ncbi:META domain-containing protein [Seonamhaeicola aphaedonensis]|uniref:META domain-containing protein n=1 Tax=Seonamhaeicola aphaedonensis TaxID=1461338 RepID=A0A3D9HLW3_9FLAO|nr:META domain-containing protein [Seonamhaeicola aphaedonensis]RED50464.1 META domain-containing protein [Seonamhaeicola aphaedonensis]